MNPVRLVGAALPLLVMLTLQVHARGSVGSTLLSSRILPTDRLEVVIILDADPAWAAAVVGLPAAYVETRAFLEATNKETVKRFLGAARAQGVAIDVTRTFWLAPMVSATIRAEDLERVASLPQVASIVENAPVITHQPVRSAGAQPAADATLAGQDAVGARALWRRGLTGKGRLAASIDTGVDGLHPALRNRYRGLRAPSASAWFDPFGGTFPDDPVGHGTHTLGTVLGCEAGDTVGIAPAAEWIAAGVVDRGLSFSETIADLVGAFEWLADPDGDPATFSDVPDVVLNSWGIPRGVLPDCDDTFWQVVDNLEALGAVVVFAAGNEGPGLSTLRSPADRDDIPLACFSVGAINALDPDAGVAAFSSRGPTICNPAIVKPEIVAPGVNVRSCKPGGGYQLMSGTSMAAPYVAGAVLLLRQYNPDATPSQIKTALVAAARDLGVAGADYASGYGVLNIERAVELLLPPAPVRWRWNVPVLQTPGEPQAELAFPASHVVMENLGRSLQNVTVAVSPRHSGVALVGTSQFQAERLAAGDGRIDMPLVVASADCLPAGERIWLDVRVQSTFPLLDSMVTLGLQVGPPPPTTALAQRSRRLTTTATNFGRFDATYADVRDVVLTDFTFDGRSIVFAGGLRFISGPRDEHGLADSSVFEPSPSGRVEPGDLHYLSSTCIRDTRLADPIGLELRQQVIAGPDGPGDYIIYDYRWSRLLGCQDPVQPGAWFRWDLEGLEMAAGLDPGAPAVCIAGDGMYVGVVWLGTAASADARAWLPGTAVLPAPAEVGRIDASAQSYLLSFVAAPTGREEDRFGVALVAAGSREEWVEAAERAVLQYERLATGDAGAVPYTFELLPNFPNPFNPATTLRYTLDTRCPVRLEIYNLLGRRVRTLTDGVKEAGSYALTWEATDDSGRPLPSGVYLLRLESEGRVRSAKMTLLR